MCSHSIFYVCISVVLKGSQVSPKITSSFICSYVATFWVAMYIAMLNAHCAKVVLETIDIVGRRKLCYA